MKHLFLIIFLFVSALSYCQNMLDSYIDIAINNSPLIKTKYNDLLAKKEDIKAKVSLENPELSVSLLPKPMMNVNGEQIASVSIMQMFPWFGTLSNNRKMLECETQSAYWTLVNSLNDIIYNVKILYYDMTLLNCQIKTLENQKQILQQIKETLIIDYASKGQNSIPNLNNIEIKKEELDLEILTLQTTLNTKKQQFNNLLHQNLQDEILLLYTINND
ncbi:MAG: TolC family protein [Bacteroidota bacterium]|nr:TolC family protein [Bacteroidota bacterium]